MGGTTSLTLVHNRPVMTLDGDVRAVVDTGGAAILMAQAAADALDLAVIETVEEQGEVFTVLEPPTLSVGGYELDTDGLPTYGFEDTRRLGLAASAIDVLLPSTLVARHAVVLDGVTGEATWDDPGSLAGEGVRVRADVDRSTGLIVCEAEVLGGAVRFLLDTGVSCSLASDSLVQSWLRSMPDLPRSAAAVGPGNMAGLPAEARTPMVRVPLVEWGEFTVPAVAFVWRADADLAPFDGSLGGNVLRSFRLGLDLGRGEVWVEQRAPVAMGGDADQVGVTLLLDDDGEWAVGAVLTGLDGVTVGDRIESIDGARASGLPIDAVLAALAGDPGVTTHHLVLRHPDDGALVEADLPVARVL